MSNNQMREALRLLQEIHPGNMTPMAEVNWNKAIEILQALAAEPAEHVKKTPESMHVEGDMYTPAEEAQPVAWQGGLSNEQLIDCWKSKLPNREATANELSAFALGVEIGAAIQPIKKDHYIIRHNGDGEFGQQTGWLYRDGGEPCAVSGQPVYVWRPLSELIGTSHHPTHEAVRKLVEAVEELHLAVRKNPLSMREVMALKNLWAALDAVRSGK